MMDNAVNNGRSHHSVSQYLTPVLKAAVRGDNNRSFLVALTDDFKEVVNAANG